MSPQQIEDIVSRVGADANLTAPQMAAIFELVVVCIEGERERCASLIENGSFLHEGSPAKRFATEAAAAIRREPT